MTRSPPDRPGDAGSKDALGGQLKSSQAGEDGVLQEGYEYLELLVAPSTEN